MSDESCRILTISSTIEGALQFIESLKALSAASPSSSQPSSHSPSAYEIQSHSAIPLTVPWTITNRYYTAKVHFSAWTIDKLFPELFEGQPPAVVFAWFENEPYAKHAEEIARLMRLREYEPEVALAVRLPSSQTELSPAYVGERQDEEDGDIDSVLMSYGFEYVDATRSLKKHSEDATVRENKMDDDIPALPRVLDALSTIMWPSMQSSNVGSTIGGLKASLNLNDSFGESDWERENMLQDLIFEAGGNEQIKECEGQVEEEDEELMEKMKALVLDAEVKSQKSGRLWLSTSSSTSTPVLSPTEMDIRGGDTMSPFETHPGKDPKEKPSLRFDDDFTVFVSAPALPEGQEKPPNWMDCDSTSVPESAHWYRSLGSVSDFGECDDGVYSRLDDGDEEDGMPSKKEINETARRIFGGPEDRSQAFDLKQVFDVLQEYKSEIAGMENEEEKKKAAATVALGLVYGLEGT